MSNLWHWIQGLTEAGAKSGGDVILEEKGAAETHVEQQNGEIVLEQGTFVEGGDDEDDAILGEIFERDLEMMLDGERPDRFQVNKRWALGTAYKNENVIEVLSFLVPRDF